MFFFGNLIELKKFFMNRDGECATDTISNKNNNQQMSNMQNAFNVLSTLVHSKPISNGYELMKRPKLKRFFF